MRPLFLSIDSGSAVRWITLVDCPDFLSYPELAESLYSDNPRRLDQTDILIVRPRVDQPRSQDSPCFNDIEALAKRAPRASLHLLCTENFEIHLSDNLNSRVENRLADTPSERWISWLRNEELTGYIRQSSALFRARENFIYRSPSGRYVNMFLRVGNVQTNRQALDSFFFWMLPYLRDRTAILAETWSISSIALNAARFLDRYRQYQIPNCRVDMLAWYHDDWLDRAPETLAALRRVTEDGSRKALVLISAVSTGTSLRNLRQTIDRSQINPQNFEFLALFKLYEGTQIQALCDLSNGLDGERFDPQDRPASGTKSIIEIDPRVYFPLQVVEGTPVRLRNGSAAPGRPFFQKYQGTGAIALHRNAVDLSNQLHRHHGIYIDVERLLELSDFKTNFFQKLESVPMVPALIVAPPHRAGKKLADLSADFLSRRFGISVRTLLHPDLRPESPDTPRESFESLAPSDLVLLVDDVAVTGTRLGRYRVSLRQLGCQARLFHLIGVARPDSEESWQWTLRDWTYRPTDPGHPHFVECIEKLILPDWNERTCPWCNEQHALRLLYKSPDLQKSLRQLIWRRIRQLQHASSLAGLTERAYWRIDESADPRLTRDSIFFEYQGANDADAIAAVAAALQQMRTRKIDRLELTYPHVTILDSEDYFGETTFTDVALRLAMVRAAKRTELEHWRDEEEHKRRDKVRNYLLSPDRAADVIRLEFCVAWLAGKLPYPRLENADWESLHHSATADLIRCILARC